MNVLAKEKEKEKAPIEDEAVEDIIDEIVEEDELKKMSEELEQWKDKYYRTLADTSNLQKRLEHEAIQSKKYQIQSFALNVLPVLDNLDRALQQETSDEALHKGVAMVRQQLWEALQKEGVEEIDAQGKPFDGNFHHAILKEEVEGVEPGMVVEVLQKGYILKDRILRAALVKVSE